MNILLIDGYGNDMKTEVEFDVLCKRKKPCKPPKNRNLIGMILIGIGIGLFLAFILPYQLLITILGIALIYYGISGFKNS